MVLALTAEHTGIGLLALAITELEANPVPTRLTRKNPIYEAYQCFAQCPDFPEDLKDMVVKSRKSEKILRKFASYLSELSGPSKAAIATTRAVDLVHVSDGATSFDCQFLLVTLMPTSPHTRVASRRVPTNSADVGAYLRTSLPQVNALPEVATAVVNHRINADSSVRELQEQMTEVLAPLADKLGISFRSFGKDVFIKLDSPVVLELNVAFNST
jgi:Gly-Xaa carboxypeptidase